eukprot:COSAG03_NODE_2140_length_3084_cov_81.247571_5_plen_232_part_00
MKREGGAFPEVVTLLRVVESVLAAVQSAHVGLAVPHKDFSDLYEEMSGRGENAVLSRVPWRASALSSGPRLLRPHCRVLAVRPGAQDACILSADIDGVTEGLGFHGYFEHAVFKDTAVAVSIDPLGRSARARPRCLEGGLPGGFRAVLCALRVPDPAGVVGEEVALHGAVPLVDCVVHIGLCLPVATARLAQLACVVGVAVIPPDEAVPCETSHTGIVPFTLCVVVVGTAM